MRRTNADMSSSVFLLMYEALYKAVCKCCGMGDKRFGHLPTRALPCALGCCSHFHNFWHQCWRCIGIQNCLSNVSRLSDDLVFQAGAVVSEIETEETGRKAGNYDDDVKVETVIMVM
jgi:hypothetical protein